MGGGEATVIMPGLAMSLAKLTYSQSSATEAVVGEIGRFKKDTFNGRKI